MVVLLAGTAVAGDDSSSRSLAPAAIETVNGRLFAWPALDAPAYAGADVAPFRDMLARWRTGARPRGLPARPHAPATRYLAADLLFLAMTVDAAKGVKDGFGVLEAYERVLRKHPDFPDAPRARFMLGATQLAVGLFPEAAASFARCAPPDATDALAVEAQIAEASALGRGGRRRDARKLLDAALAHAQGDALCRAHRAEAALADKPADAATAFAALAAACPQALGAADVVREWATALVAAGDVDGARRLISGARPVLADEDEARIRLLAGTIAVDADAARLQYEHVLGLHVSPAIALEAEMRLALVETEHDPERRASALTALAKRDGPRATRAIVLGEAADAAAQAGRFEEALAVLDQATALGPEGVAQADARRPRVLGRWIGALAARGDAAGVATVYAAYTTEIEEGCVAEDRVAVGRALGSLGLHAAAVRVLQRAASRPDVAATLAEEALSAGDADGARAAARRVLAARAPELAGRAHAVLARLALRANEVDAAAIEAAASADVDVRADVARALLAQPDGASRAGALVPSTDDAPARVLLVAGDVAFAQGAWPAAEDAYRKALAAASPGPERAAAAAGLARAAQKAGEPAEAARALAALSDVGDAPDAALCRRVAAATRRPGGRRGR
jgi:tetratricopeptide (TPR) repeat protein